MDLFIYLFWMTDKGTFLFGRHSKPNPLVINLLPKYVHPYELYVSMNKLFKPVLITTEKPKEYISNSIIIDFSELYNKKKILHKLSNKKIFYVLYDNYDGSLAEYAYYKLQKYGIKNVLILHGKNLNAWKKYLGDNLVVKNE